MTHMLKKPEHPLFSEATIKEIPLHYRYMTPLKTSGIDELYIGQRFSTSVRHNSSEYINFGAYKPISTILLKELP